MCQNRVSLGCVRVALGGLVTNATSFRRLFLLPAAMQHHCKNRLAATRLSKSVIKCVSTTVSAPAARFFPLLSAVLHAGTLEQTTS